jgi:hypothetical protein
MPLTTPKRHLSLAGAEPKRGKFRQLRRPFGPETPHFAGGIVLNVSEHSPRFSKDFDIFHELAEEVTRASNNDVNTLRVAGFEVATSSRDGEWEKEATFRKAKITRGKEMVEIDWAVDSAFRFFPIERDAQLGWRLHLFDVATNNALALSARTETRDYVDIVELHKTYPLPAICWAACGKDPGFTPLLALHDETIREGQSGQT